MVRRGDCLKVWRKLNLLLWERNLEPAYKSTLSAFPPVSFCDGSALPCLRVTCFLQLGRSVGPTVLQFLLELLKHLVIHAEQLDAQNQRKLEAARAESDLFLDMESVASLELATDKVRTCPLLSFSHKVAGTGYF